MRHLLCTTILLSTLAPGLVLAKPTSSWRNWRRAVSELKSVQRQFKAELDAGAEIPVATRDTGRLRMRGRLNYYAPRGKVVQTLVAKKDGYFISDSVQYEAWKGNAVSHPLPAQTLPVGVDVPVKLGFHLRGQGLKREHWETALTPGVSTDAANQWVRQRDVR
jgi:hypothetical protein